MRRAAQFGAITVTTITMVVLYYGLMELAREAGYTKWQAALFPFPVDGLVLVAYIAAYAFDKKRYQVYAWFVVGFGAALSATGQFLHTQSLVGTVVAGIPTAPGGSPHTVQWWASLLAVAPALASPLALHLAVSLTRITEPKRTTLPPVIAPTPVIVPQRGTSIREGWPLELEDDFKKVMAKEITISDVARRIIKEQIRTSSPDLSNARKLATRWMQNWVAREGQENANGQTVPSN